MAISRLTSQDVVATGTNTIAFPGATIAGDLLLCVVEAYVGAGTAFSISGWTLFGSAALTSNNQTVYLFGKIASGSETTITLTPGSAGYPPNTASLCEYTGNVNPLTLDGAVVTTSLSAGGLHTVTTAPITTTLAADLIFSICAVNVSYSSPAWATSTLILGANDSGGAFCGQYLPGAVKTSFTDTATWGSNPSAPATIVAAFVAKGTYDSYLTSLSPAGWWKLADTSGSTTAADSSGNGRTMTATGAVSFGNPGPLVVSPDTCAQFSGADLLTISNNIVGGTPTALSEVCWFKSTSSGASDVLMMLQNPACFWGATLDAGQVKFYAQDSGGNTNLTSPLTYDDGNWHMIAHTWDGANVRLYVDGVLVAGPTAQTNAPNFGATPVFTIGSDNYGDYLTGSVAEVAVFASALTATAISNLFVGGGPMGNTGNAGIGGFF